MSGSVADVVDDRGIPSIEPALIPQIVDGDTDWRRDMDALREQFPFFRVGSDPTIWVTRWEAARDIFADGELFYEPNWVEQFGAPDALLEGSGFHMSDDFSASAGLKHQLRMRQAVMDHFSPKYVRTWEPRMREVCQELIAKFVDRGECDYVNDFSKYYFPYLSAQWLGAPEADWDDLVEWEHKIFMLRPSEGDDRLLHMTGEWMIKLLGYLESLMEAKRRKPDGSFTDFVLNATIDGRRFTDEEARGCLTIVALGSAHTVTSHLGYFMRHLAEDPEHRRAIVTDPQGIPALGEELLRQYSLFGHPRVVTRDVEFHGLQLRRGEQLFILYSMPNRDPRCPGFDHLDPKRKPNPHLAFNYGPRRCIGVHWSRRTRDVAVEEWHKAIPDYRIKDGTELVEQVYAGTGYPSLPLVWS